jgi:hypothetical protein
LQSARSTRARERGTTFVELMGAITIISLATLVMLQQLTISYREGTVQHERLWGYDKCTQILAELQSGVERGTIPDAEALHALADATYNPVLTTIVDEVGNPLAPDHPMSGNWQRLGRWVWGRQIEVTSPAGQDRIRYVALRLAKFTENGTPTLVASMTTVVTLPRRTYPSTLVYDVYALALAEVPSPLGSLAELRSSLEASMRAASSEASGVEFRVHWITRLGYGRDALYTPTFNDQAVAQTFTPPLYWYPELVETGARLFFSEYFTGRLRRASGVVNDYDATARPFPHAIADQFNHCLRLPDARALYQERLAAGLENGHEPPLQILLADIAESPDRFRNAIVVNLHGDGLPFPPVRNYSDAAAAPDVMAGARVVTHAAKLHTPRDVNGDGNNADSEDLELRVYAYKQDVGGGTADVLAQPITVQIFGGDLRSHLSVRRLSGGVDEATGAADSNAPYFAFDSVAGSPPTTDPSSFAMWCETGYSTTPAPHTWIRLYNTPLVCPAGVSGGLSTGMRLYGLEYVPTPLSNTVLFDRDLATSGSVPKNTARWRLRIGKTALGTVLPGFDQTLTITTRIGTDLSTGTVWPTANQPRNKSNTYVWWTRSADAVPPLERYQFLGDPRHNPYADVAAAARYNCYFAGSGIPLNASAWDAIDATRLRETGFGEGMTSDVPRALTVIRQALQGAGMVYTNVAQLANRLYLGGEIGAASSGGTTVSKIEVPGAWFASPDPVLVESVTSGPCMPAAPPAEPMASLVGEHVLVGPGNLWVKPWLGELYADADYGTWLADGNLGTGTYHREVRAQSTPADLPSGAVLFGLPAGATAGTIGGTTLAQVGTALGTFAHGPVAGATGVLTPEGREVPKLFGQTWPSQLSAQLPFSFALVGDPAAPHFTHPADFPVQSWQLLESHVTSSSTLHISGGLFRVSNASNATAFLELMALTPPAAADVKTLLDLGVAQSVRALQSAGRPGVTGRIEQVGRVEITEPPKGGLAADPSSVKVTWRVDFLGFDGQLPLGYSAGFTEDEANLCYSLLYSRDAGQTWRYAINGAVAKPGERPEPALLIPDSGAGNESLTVPTSAVAFPAGEVLWRVEAFHVTRGVHYGHHTVLITVTR